MSASSRRKSITASLAIALAALLALTDQLIKNLIVENFRLFEVRPFLGDVVKLTYVLNDSAAFSLGFGFTGIFTLLSSAAAIALIWFIIARSRSVGWSIMAGVLLGGVLGNLTDRLLRSPGGGLGKVVDYIQIPFNFPIFNLADIAIVSMAILAALRIMLGHSVGRPSKEENV
ncbi:MAG: signal peptidase II [Rhodoluna sp.]|nr:signal peptidase II [Rhodoluna sp.]